mmetsp:Transcript_26853/g.53631  ORF Transcript_26853/g.53631 Transcript_26853/m.53631 type:complete len:202 (+) Transcript_26853:272-877(+)|eukprot:CAMPEP_0194318390 /NCGR_PEP_ID=MMETSP0171-20130528/15004_1 /TAXON_ID=218684 /ORGANISM="Corethron pennatum, Strain L29A3" /LENGTH=201 /DNA_ID=CAMNT_0039075277 /DNA_START=166 /DNA_END=771 /DNA_ORIENTATION=-
MTAGTRNVAVTVAASILFLAGVGAFSPIRPTSVGPHLATLSNMRSVGPSLTRGDAPQWRLGMLEEDEVVKTAAAPLAPQTTDAPVSPVEQEWKLPMLLDIGTKGGALFLSLVLFIVPIIFYNILVSAGFEDVDVGRYIGVGFTVLSLIGWASTYIFRVATKDMTYAKQLKDYENAVIAKRLEELEDDEVQALVEEMERDSF